MEEHMINLFEHIPYKDIGIAFLIFLVFFLISKIFTKYILELITRIVTKTSKRIDEYIIKSFKQPVSLFLIATGLYLGLHYLPLSANAIHFITKIYRSIIIILIGGGLFRFSNATKILFNHVSTRLNLQFNKIIIPFLTKIIKFIVIALTIAALANEWGYNIDGIVAGLGLGGLAVALAAKDTVSNLFGGLVIITESPFTIDDWIQTPSVEGTVEDISFRSTKIRTFTQAVVTVPNSTLVNEAITNWSRMGKRRILFNLQLDIHTPKDKMVNCAASIREMLKSRNDIDQETILVHFYQFSPSSLDIQLYFFTKTTTYDEWLEVNEQVNTEILAILEKHQVDLAVPIQKTYNVEGIPSFKKHSAEDDYTMAQERTHS
ncbi:mechanosensitive ion channel family protein [Scopulibacillus cellulosilyticus]|uniref:Mechanosensitive ion channel family protein n=1 Tax=Scopulibacillus cellulosilyticus TaxID=2665665 RepID=A0ABW2PYE0_9BACL